MLGELSGDMHDGSSSNDAPAFVLIEIHDVIFVSYQFVRTRYTVAGPAWKVGVRQFINLFVYQ